MDLFKYLFTFLTIDAVMQLAECAIYRRAASKCPRFNGFPNGNIRYRRGGNRAVFKCVRGFQRYGSKRRNCRADGTWNGEMPLCIKSGCVPVDISQSPFLDMTEQFSGALLKFTCEAGYQLDGATESTCDGNTWSDPLPECTATFDLTRCDFEQSLCGWTQDDTDEGEWKQHAGSTNTGNTGPKFDHTHGLDATGHYMFFEASTPAQEGDQARLFSPEYAPDMSPICFGFWYHMLGPDDSGHVGSLEVFILGQSQFIDDLNATFYIDGNQGDSWNEGEVVIPPMSEPFQIVIEATRKLSYISDIAIDDIGLHNCSHDEFASITSTSTPSTTETTTTEATTPTTPKPTPKQTAVTTTTIVSTSLATAAITTTQLPATSPKATATTKPTSTAITASTKRPTTTVAVTSQPVTTTITARPTTTQTTTIKATTTTKATTAKPTTTTLITTTTTATTTTASPTTTVPPTHKPTTIRRTKPTRRTPELTKATKPTKGTPKRTTTPAQTTLKSSTAPSTTTTSTTSTTSTVPITNTVATTSQSKAPSSASSSLSTTGKTSDGSGSMVTNVKTTTSQAKQATDKLADTTDTTQKQTSKTTVVASEVKAHPDDETLKPLMIGLGVGIVAGLIIIGVIAYICVRRRKFYTSRYEDELKPITKAGSANSLNNDPYYPDEEYQT